VDRNIHSDFKPLFIWRRSTAEVFEWRLTIPSIKVKNAGKAVKDDHIGIDDPV
jgi:hypothetical protein